LHWVMACCCRPKMVAFTPSQLNKKREFQYVAHAGSGWSS